jgi:hypothetical protein
MFALVTSWNPGPTTLKFGPGVGEMTALALVAQGGARLRNIVAKGPLDRDNVELLVLVALPHKKSVSTSNTAPTARNSEP